MTAFSPPAESWIIQYPKRETKNPTDQKMRVPEEKQLDIGCRQYIESSEIPVKSNRSLGTDDHFKSMVCSKNLLKVCEKVIGTRPSGSNTTDQIGFYQGHSRFSSRRGSQSLPPSPKLERKSIFETTAVANHNPYFTITKSAAEQKESNISFLTSLFGPATKREGSKQELDRIDVVIPDTSIDATAKQRQPNTGFHRPTPNEYREMNLFTPTSM